MRRITQLLSACALAAPLVVGGAGLAAASDGPAYVSEGQSATAAGGARMGTASGFGQHGKAFFETFAKMSGPSGAVGTGTGSHS